MKKVPLFRQMGQHECGPACLTMILNYYNRPVSLNKISEQCDAQRNGVSVTTLKKVSEYYGLNCKVYQINSKDINSDISHCFPCILFWDNQHFVVLEKVRNNEVTILDPNKGKLKLKRQEFESHYSGVILIFNNTNMNTDMTSFSTKRFYLPYIFENWVLISAVLIFSIFTQGVTLLTSFLIKYILDNSILNNNSLSMLSLLGLGIITSFLMFSIFVLLRKYFEIKLQAKLSKNLSTDFMEHLVKLPIKFFESRTTGDITMRINNITMIREILAKSGITILLDIITLIIFFIAMLTISIKLAFVAIGLAFIQFFLVVILIPKTKDFIRNDLSSQTATQSFLVESLRAIPFIKSNGLDQAIVDRWSYYNNRQISMFTKRYLLDAVIETIVITIRFCTPLILLWVGSREVIYGNLSLGSLVGLGVLGLFLVIPVSSVITNIRQFQMMDDIFERTKDVLETKQENYNHKQLDFELSNQDIKLKNITFTHQKVNIIKNISLDINAGSKVALVGRTGSGKTTLSRIILGLYQPTNGEVLIGDKNLIDLNLTDFRKQTGAVLQDSFLFNDTIRNNISGFKDIPQQAIERATKKVKLDEEIANMPMGYNTIIGENGSMLSGGQRQRLAIARAIVHNPSVVILDEITSNLDTATEQHIDDYIDQLDITRIMITHRLQSTKNADLIVVLSQGEIVEKGTHKELLRQKGEYYYLWNKKNSEKININE
ncbi:peptidase domain-containing ABC transporter [Oceanobacillus sp. J11TS1]|uniref:peptidase domain-containing ABC transporter n=1 Tax=Oceanobacillus sp. J11TS1 TaxID=2807191 RepID=UPI001B06A594|nr:peptidase domain-containing ABC transporter [Oceanobacillus sp. J11TS1]GIO22992.1 peptidase C39 [Oceanobacillus sp. J11TS1]